MKQWLEKLIIISRTPTLHYRNRLKKRSGSHWLFLLATRNPKKLYQWQYRHHTYIVRDGQLKTYLNLILRKAERRYEKRLKRLRARVEAL